MAGVVFFSMTCLASGCVNGYVLSHFFVSGGVLELPKIKLTPETWGKSFKTFS
jgi:hypothetical protein